MASCYGDLQINTDALACSAVTAAAKVQIHTDSRSILLLFCFFFLELVLFVFGGGTAAGGFCWCVFFLCSTQRKSDGINGKTMHGNVWTFFFFLSRALYHMYLIEL